MPDKSTAATQTMEKKPHPLSPSLGLPTSMPDQPLCLDSGGEPKPPIDDFWQVAPTSIDKLRRQGCRDRHGLMTWL